MIQVDLNLSTILSGLTVLGVAGIFRQLWLMNGSMRSMKVWQEAHEKSDDERHQEIRAGQDALWEFVNGRRR